MSKICAKGNRVVFDGPDSYIEHKITRARMQIKESSDAYVIDVTPCRDERQGFGGPGA